MTLVQTEPKKIYIRVDVSYSPDITTATQDQSIKPVSFSNQRCIDVSPDGSNILLVEHQGNTYQFTLSTPFDLTSTITNKNKAMRNGYNYIDFAMYSEDGTHVYTGVSSEGGDGGGVIQQWDLSTAWDISTATYSKTTANVGTGNRVGGMRFYDNGTKIIGVTRSTYIFTAELTTAWDISTMTNFTRQTNSVNVYGQYGEGFAISPDGKTCYMVSEYESNIAQLTSTTAYNFSSATKTTRSVPASPSFGIDVTNDGKYAFVALQNGTIYRYSFATL